MTLTDQEFEEFKEAYSWITPDDPTREYAEEFFDKNLSIYWLGKEWGFNDTEVRERIMSIESPIFDLERIEL